MIPNAQLRAILAQYPDDAAVWTYENTIIVSHGDREATIFASEDKAADEQLPDRLQLAPTGFSPRFHSVQDAVTKANRWHSPPTL